MTQGLRRSTPLLAVGLALLATGLLPWRSSWICALGAIILLGVPHGALDVEVARNLLRRRFGWVWFPVFAAPYLLLAAAVILCWTEAPLWTLAAFIAASVWHFGTGDASQNTPLEVMVRGGLPIAAPMAAHPAATTFIFWTVAGVPPAQAPHWLWPASLGWVLLLLWWLAAAASQRRWKEILMVAAGTCMFFAAPPLTAFAIYFVCVHSPAHVRQLILTPSRAPRVTSAWTAAVFALPMTAVTVLIGASLWPMYNGPFPERLLSLTIQELGALTLPHMLFGIWLDHRERRVWRSAFPHLLMARVSRS